MRAPYLVYTFLILSFGYFHSYCYAQKAIGDTFEASKTGPAPRADEVFFNAVKAEMLDDSALARQLFEQFVVLKPEAPDGYYELSKLYQENRNTDKAEEDIKQAVALNKDNKWYKEEYASILGDESKYKEAAKVMGDLSQSEPEDPNYPIVTSEYYERAKLYPEAIAYMDKAIARNGADEDVLMRKVQLYLDMNDVEKAAVVVEELIKDNPRNGKYYKELGDLYDNNKMPEKAAKVYERAQKVVPGDPAVQLGIAEHFLITGDTASYFEYVKKAVINKGLDADTQLDLLKAYIQSLPNNSDSILKVQGMPIIRELVSQHPDNSQVMDLFGEFLDLNNQHDSAVIVYKSSLAIAPSNFNIWEKVLQVYSGGQDADSLLKYSGKAMKLFPTQALIYYYNSVGYYNKKDYPAAAKAMKRAIDLQPDSNPELLAQMYSVLADIYHQSRQDELSDEAFEKALKLQPNDAFVLNNYSYYLSERGKKLDEAERMSKKSLALKPNEATFLDTYGWILYQTGAYEKAKEYIQKAIDMAGDRVDATLYDHLGDVYFRLKDKDKAIENWKIAKEKGAEDPNIDKKISEGKLYE